MACLEDLNKLLNMVNTDRYYIDYAMNGEEALTNHITMGLIALYKLGASIDLMQTFIDCYTRKIEDAEPYKKSTQMIEPKDEFLNMRGKGENFYGIKDYLERIIGDDIETELGKIVPELVKWMIGWSTHGLLATGYAYSIKRREAIIEGLAAFHYGYMEPNTDIDMGSIENLTQGKKTIFEVVEMVRNDKDISQYMDDKFNDPKWQTPSPQEFDRKCGAIFLNRVDDIFLYVKQIELPVHIIKSDIAVKERAHNIGKWIIDTAILVYVSHTKRNDFFILHGVTSGYALSQLLPTFTSHGDLNQALFVYLAALLTIYVLQGSHLLDQSLLDDENASIRTWNEISQETLSLPIKDEHVYKLVQVCMERSQENVDDKMKAIYKIACHVALTYPFE